MKGILIDILLVSGLAVCLLSSIGIWAMRGVYDKLHYLSPMSTLGTALLAAAIVAGEGLSSGGIKTILVALLVFVSAPLLTQATARAAERRESRTTNAEEERTP